MVAVKSSKYKEASSLKRALIKEIQKFPALYDEDEPPMNAAQRTNCWTMIGSAVGVKGNRKYHPISRMGH
jgi:hypothetical protein